MPSAQPSFQPSPAASAIAGRLPAERLGLVRPPGVHGDLAEQVEPGGGPELVARRPGTGPAPPAPRARRPPGRSTGSAGRGPISACPLIRGSTSAASARARNASTHSQPIANSPRTSMHGRIAVQIRSPVADVALGEALAQHQPDVAARPRRTCGTRPPGPAMARARAPCPRRSSARPRRACSRGAGAGDRGRLARRGQLLRRVLADRVEHPEPGLAEHLRARAPPATCPRSAPTVSRTLPAGTSSSAHTCSAISSDQPAKTDSRRSSTCSRSVSRSWLQSIAARSVRWRGGAVRSPVRQQPEPVGHPHPDLVDGERADPGGGQLDRQRDAVEGTADFRDGAGVLRGERETGAAASARSEKSWTASPGDVPVAVTGSGGTGQTVSPATRSGSRLVASSRSSAELASSRWLSRAHASSRCSQLSSASTSLRRTQRVGQRVEQRPAALLRDTRGGRDAGGHQVRTGRSARST